MQDYKKKGSFSPRFSINVFYSPISLSFPLHRCLCSARGKNVFPFSSALCISCTAHWCLFFFFSFKYSSGHEYDLDCGEYCWRELLSFSHVNMIFRCHQTVLVILQEPLEWICKKSFTENDTDSLIKPLVETSGVIRFDSITDVMHSMAVLHEVFFLEFFFTASLGRLHTPGLNSLNASRLLLLHTLLYW